MSNNTIENNEIDSIKEDPSEKNFFLLIIYLCFIFIIPIIIICYYPLASCINKIKQALINLKKMFFYCLIISFDRFCKLILNKICKRIEGLYKLISNKNYKEIKNELEGKDEIKEDNNIINSEDKDKNASYSQEDIGNNSEDNGQKESNDDEKCSFNIDGDIMYGITFLARIIITYYSFYGLLFIYNFVIQYIILIHNLIFKIENNSLKYVLLLFLLFLSYCFSKILVIPTFDFFSFPFLNFRDSLSHLWSFNYIYENKKFETEKITKRFNFKLNFLFILLEICFFITYGLGVLSINITLKDLLTSFILIIIYSYYLIITACYILINFFLKLRCSKNGLEKREKLPDINLVSYYINPSLEKSNENENKDNYSYYNRIFHNVVIFIFEIVYLIFFIKNNEGDIKINFLISIIYFIGIFNSFLMRFPFFFRDKIKFNSNLNIENEYNPKNRLKVSIIRYFCLSICLIISFILSFISIKIKDKNHDDSIDFNEFQKIRPIELDSNEPKDLLLPSLCYSTIHGIPITLFIPFINDAYYYHKNISSFNYSGYRHLFFNDSEYKIMPIGNLINDSSKGKVKMIHYNLISSNNNVTILSIKGTSNKKDMYLDLQLYIPSVFLNLLTTFSIFTKLKDTYSFYLVEYSLSIPYRLFFKIFIIDDYINDLEHAFNENIKKFSKNVVIVGHSLGGGLSKILGKRVKKQSISLSGPGVNAFHSLWGYEGISENFDISTIDLVPDMDLVPRVEVSGGTILRIICREGPFGCHNKAYSLCEVLIMCRNPNREIYCRKMANLNDLQIKTIFKNSELN